MVVRRPSIHRVIPAKAGISVQGEHGVREKTEIPAFAGMTLCLTGRMSTEGHFFVYMLASRKYGSIYIGVTGDLPGRTYLHREALTPGFTSRYRIYRLVYFEQHDEPLAAITREKQLKKWRRDWKIELIERDNPEWRDLFEQIAS